MLILQKTKLNIQTKPCKIYFQFVEYKENPEL